MKNKCYKYFVNCEINVIKIYNKMIKLNEFNNKYFFIIDLCCKV